MELFVSDLHLETTESARFEAFARLLELESTRATGIYLLGDLCEVWVGDDDDGPLAEALVALLGAVTHACPVYLMHGNRDFLIDGDFARATGVELIDDPHVLDTRTLLTHGDRYCTADTNYQSLRLRLRDPAWRAETLARSLESRRDMAAALREASRQALANKAENITDVSADAVAAEAGRYDVSCIIHGHTHRPGIHRHTWGERVVLGAWEDRCGWLARREGGEIRLECLSLADRCGI